MAGHLEPTEEFDGRISVTLLDDTSETEVVHCSSYEKAISVVREHQHNVAAAKIVNRDGDVVFSSADMEIDVWESIWRNEMKTSGVDVEEYDCPYDSISCFADDLCVQCKMDKVQNNLTR